jgi:hypothetical protein
MPWGVSEPPDSRAASGARTVGATACRTRDRRAGIPGLLPSGERAWALSRRRAAWGIPGLHDDGAAVPFLHQPNAQRAEPGAGRGVSTRFHPSLRTNDSEAGLKMFGDGWFMRRSKHPTDRLWIEFACCR